MKISWRKIKWAAGLAALTLLMVLGGLAFISLRIGAEVRSISEIAMQEYSGDKVEALVMMVEDQGRGWEDRNRAIWALGQWGDRRALPVLRRHFTGEPCDHARALCQRELGKAIRLLEGGVNLTAWIWRRGSET